MVALPLVVSSLAVDPLPVADPPMVVDPSVVVTPPIVVEPPAVVELPIVAELPAVELAVVELAVLPDELGLSVSLAPSVLPSSSPSPASVHETADRELNTTSVNPAMERVVAVPTRR